MVLESDDSTTNILRSDLLETTMVLPRDVLKYIIIVAVFEDDGITVSPTADHIPF